MLQARHTSRRWASIRQSKPLDATRSFALHLSRGAHLRIACTR
jgi:hypothetical protein